MNAAVDRPLVRVRDLHKVRGSAGGTSVVLDAVSLEVKFGELALIMGPSGSGKTTLLSIVGGVLRPTSGVVDVCGVAVSDLPETELARFRRTHIGFVFQSYNLFAALSARENVSAILRLKGMPEARARQRAQAALETVGLAHRADHRPAAMSGGERQRVAIARAFAGSPRLILGDEITAALDGQSAFAVMQIVRGYVKPETGVILITHDRRLERFAHRVIEIEDGRVHCDRVVVPETDPSW
jgi:putative ABC transport system ATP-binding protein